MKYLHLIIRFAVGGLFIFSGLIKVNDPIGTAIKLQEYFEVFALDFAGFFHFFVPYALPLAVFVVVLEVVLGVAVIINYRMRWTVLILLLLILFFSFLTFYSAYFEKVTDCGCFGDAIPLNPWQSFYKDLILLVLILWLFLFRGKYEQVYRSLTSHSIMVLTVIINLFLAIQAIEHLPYIDFRPYKIGDNIKLNMEYSEPPKYLYVMEKDGQKEEFAAYPTDTSYAFVEMVRLNPESDPKITDYRVWDKDNQDMTEYSFVGAKLILVIDKAEKSRLGHYEEVRNLISHADAGGYEPMIFTSSSPNIFEEFRHEYQLAAPYYFVDATVCKAMIRSNPGVMLVRNGTVLGKWHANDIPEPETLTKILKLGSN